ncbi:GPN-loop GTPase 3 isoform X2 [Odontomachus brunneus]|nr:GPN-loop GTPase 3 isoform X2 [Odontomachus brunneus]
MQEHAAVSRRPVLVINLDPAAEYFDYEPLEDIRELIHVDDPMEDDELRFGPNGSLIYCMEYLVESKWLEEKLSEVQEDYIIFDCPGQIELYTHMTVIRKLITILQNLNFQICAVFLIDSQFMVDGSKFLSGTMAALSVMINLELPHVNILSKMDLLSKSARRQLDKYLDPDPEALLADMKKDSTNKKYHKLTKALGRLIEDYSLVRFLPLNIKSENSIADIKITIDNVLQYGEDTEVRVRDFDEQCSDDKD